jgi:hypothetical protein
MLKRQRKSLKKETLMYSLLFSVAKLGVDPGRDDTVEASGKFFLDALSRGLALEPRR